MEIDQRAVLVEQDAAQPPPRPGGTKGRVGASFLAGRRAQLPALCMRRLSMASSSQPIFISGTEESRRSV